MHYCVEYITIKETSAEYAKRIREWERQVRYEREIVKSVPEQSIVACSVEPDNDERWEPG